ncbi:hypothetical protein HOK021_33890 [Streptomyces hygroscopicus]|nr:hypothetical protein HOK021_33890 [Streptomyces hygroscopicus]
MFYGCKRWSGCDGWLGRAHLDEGLDAVRAGHHVGADAAQMSARCSFADVAVETMLSGPSGGTSYRVSVSARGCESLQILYSMIMLRDRARQSASDDAWGEPSHVRMGGPQARSSPRE